MVLGFQVEHTFKRRMSVWFRSVGFWLKGCGIFHQLTTNTYHLALSMNDLLKALCKKLRISFQSPNSVLGKPSSKGILPQPFDWCKIPVGKAKLIPDKYDKKNYYLKEDTIFDVPAFLMAKYPVTNAQYNKFIEAGGYQNKAGCTSRSASFPSVRFTSWGFRICCN